MAGIRIPQVGETVGTPQRGVQGGHLNAPEVSGVGRAIMGIGAALGDVANARRIQEEKRKAEAARQAEEDAKAYAAKAVPQMSIDLGKMDTDARAAAQPGAVGYTDGLAKQVDGYLAEAEKNAPTPQAKRYIAEHGQQMRARLLDSAYGYEVGERQANRVNEFQQGNAIAANAVGRDPSQYRVLHDQQAALIDAMDAVPDVKRKLHEANDRDLSTAAVLSAAERDPLKVEGQLRHRLGMANPQPAAGAPVGAAANIESVLKTEGGFVANDGGRGPTNFGINSTANPDVGDVSKLTKDQARAIYKARYWDAIGADALPPAMQALAFDAAVNQGVGKARRMLEEAGGDPAKFAQIRKREYSELAQRDPSKAKYLNGWLARVDKLTGPPADGVERTSGDPAIDRLDTQQAITLLGKVQAERARQDTAYRTYVSGRVQDDNAAALDGKPAPNPLTADDFVRAYGDEGVSAYAEYTARQSTGAKIPQLATQTPEQIEAIVKAAEPSAGQGYASARQDYVALHAAAKQVLTERNADPVAFAIRNNLGGTAPLKLNRPETGDQLRQRQANAAAMTHKYHVPYRILSNDETTQLTTALSVSTPQEQVQLLQQFRGSLDDSGYRAVVAQIAPEQPLTASAAAFLGAGDRTTLTPSGRLSGTKVADRVLAGQALLFPTKGGTKVELAADKFLRDDFMQRAGGAYRGQAQAQERAFGAYRAYYTATAAQRGTLGTDVLNEDIAGEAFDAVTGGIAEVNDQQVVLPWGMEADRFEQLAEGYWPRALQLAGLPETTSFAHASFAPAGGDRYYVMAGDTPLQQANGKGPVVMQINRPSAPVPVTGATALADSYGAAGF